MKSIKPKVLKRIIIIYRIFEKCDNIKIGIGSSQSANTKTNPFSTEERKQFINAAMKKRKISTKKYEIYEIPDIFNAKKWIDHVVNIVGDFDIVFSNSDWVRELFQNKNYKLANKTTIFRNKYNGSNIRKLIAEEDDEWINLVPNEVVFLIQKYNGIERIKSLYKDQDEK
ncbi:MAG: nicotinamide-nucleotide adenylyltransferase [Candidatus Lokiarchaeota archaeon]